MTQMVRQGGGLRQSDFNNTVFFAVAKNIKFDPLNIYKTNAGYHIASFDEYVTLFNTSTAKTKGTHYVFFNQDGWNRYQYITKQYRVYFAFSDTITRMLHAGRSQNQANVRNGGYNSKVNYTDMLSTLDNRFGGFVLIKDKALLKGSQVPEPSTLAIFALGLMGLGLRRKNRV